MAYFVLGLLVLALVLLGANSFVKANPKKLAETVRMVGGIGALVLAALFFVTGRVIVAVPLAGFGLMLLGRQLPFGGLRFPGGLGGQPRAGQTSRVRTASLEMTLDHDTGAMDGTVLAGSFAGRELSGMALEELLNLFRECSRNDGRAAQLLSAYLDQAHPEWRERAGPGARGSEAPSDTGPMTREEAYEILGLEPGADSSAIRTAHRTLMKKLHPDQGGSTYLAAKVNEAKDLLLSS